MKLYHYSKEFHDVLKTKAASGNMSPIEIKLERMNARKHLPFPSLPYCDHISFFFEPIPSEVLPVIFGKGHPVWFRGNELFEFEVDLEDIPEKSFYYVAESEQRTALFDKFALDRNWVEDDPEILADWLDIEAMKQRQWGEVGNNPHELEKQVKKHQGHITSAYLKASLREDFKDNFTKYASCVPHLMLYPTGGEVQYDKVQKVILGTTKRIPYTA